MAMIQRQGTRREKERESERRKRLKETTSPSLSFPRLSLSRVSLPLSYSQIEKYYLRSERHAKHEAEVARLLKLFDAVGTSGKASQRNDDDAAAACLDAVSVADLLLVLLPAHTLSSDADAVSLVAMTVLPCLKAQGLPPCIGALVNVAAAASAQGGSDAHVPPASLARARATARAAGEDILGAALGVPQPRCLPADPGTDCAEFVRQLGGMKLAIQAAVSQAFKTPEVIKLFALAQPAQLRHKLEQVQRDKRLGKLAKQVAEEQELEVLAALRRLGDPLSAEEQAFLQSNMTAAMAAFEAVSAT